jgi:hypothetical protein
MKNFLVLCICLSGSWAIAQTKMQAKKITEQDLPIACHFTGKFVDGRYFKDAAGENYLFFSTTGKYQTVLQNDTTANEDIYAYLYTGSKDGFKLTWKLTDSEKNCPFDLTAAFLEASVEITDLNRNGKAEVWLAYKLACRSDVSPATMKIFAYEGNRKYAMRGTMKIKTPDIVGGENKQDEKLKNNPLFSEYAKKKWKQIEKE